MPPFTPAGIADFFFPAAKGPAANDNVAQLPSVTGIPLVDAFRLGWFLGNKLYDWWFGRTWPKGATCYCSCPENEPSNPQSCVYGMPNGGCLGCGAICTSTVNASTCGTNGPPIVGQSRRILELKWSQPTPQFARHTQVWMWPSGTWQGDLVPRPRSYPMPGQRPNQPLEDEEPQPVGDPDPVKGPERAPYPPWVDPFGLPVKGPVVDFPPPPWIAIPGRLPNPNRAPREQPQRGPNPIINPITDPWPSVVPTPLPEAAPGRAGRPSESPGVVIGFVPGSVPWTAPTTVRREPPRGPGTKEKKWIANADPRTAAVRVLNKITEANDFIDALWDALPKKCQTKVKGSQTTPQQKFKDLYACSDQIDLCSALNNVVNNEVQDYIRGRLGRASAAATGASGSPRPVGPGTGGGDALPGGKAPAGGKNPLEFKPFECGE